MSVLILIQTVWHSDGIPKKLEKKHIKTSAVCIALQIESNIFIKAKQKDTCV